MKLHRFLLGLLLVLILSAACCGPGLTAGVKYKASGTFVDGSGGQHPWSINDAHTLLWGSEPYIPVGTVFVSQYLKAGASDENYQADIKALDTLKAKGITDIALKGPGPITSASPAALQKILDYLGANGFAYGIEMDDGPRSPLQGYVVSPNRYRLEGPSDKTTIVCNWPNVDSAIYVVVNKIDITIKANGGAVARDGKITVHLSEPLNTGEILIVYPHKSFATSTGNEDLWTGFGEYRDRVLAFFKGIKFGPGFRFFLEPFTCKMDFTKEMDGFIPDSSGFRVGFEAFLTGKYKHEGGVNAGWGLNENLDTIERAARLMPMWITGRGIPYAYDRASAHLYSVNPSIAPQVWRDIADYRDSSAQDYMNTIADTLKKQVADVPVIFKTSVYSRIYANPFGIGGFDGLGAQAYGTGEAPIDAVAGPAYALAEESGKSTWFITASTQSTGDPKASYSSDGAMFSTLDSFRAVGCKGFFVDNVLSDPNQLDWLTNFKHKIKSSWGDYKPDVIYYPTDPPTGAFVKHLAPNTWWLPTLRNGNTRDIGDGLSVYEIMGEGSIYIWSGSGARDVALSVGTGKMPAIDYPAGIKLVSKKKGLFSLALTDSPTVLRGLNLDQAFPRETAGLELDRLAKLIPEADKSGIDVKKARASLDSAKMVFGNDRFYISYGMAQETLSDLMKSFGADLWLEGEGSNVYNFGSPAPVPGASRALAMILDSDEDAPLVPYSISLRFDPPIKSSYEVWIAGTPPSDGSPLSYTFDGGTWTSVSPVDGKVENYAPGLAWYKIGTMNLFPGDHTLTLRADGRRSRDNRYYYALDAVVLSPHGFKPSGVAKTY